MTLLEKFNKDYPNTSKFNSGRPKCCPSDVGYADTPNDCLGMSCKECWNREYKGEDNPAETIEESTDVGDKIISTYIRLREYFDKGEAYSIIRDLIIGGNIK